jgi:DNA-binding transcriptional MerR regulator
MNEDEMLMPSQASRLLPIGIDTLAEYADKNLIPCIRTIGGHRRYRRRDIELLLALLSNPSKEMRE